MVASFGFVEKIVTDVSGASQATNTSTDVNGGVKPSGTGASSAIADGADSISAAAADAVNTVSRSISSTPPARRT